jgi:hypothetical protein
MRALAQPFKKGDRVLVQRKDDTSNAGSSEDGSYSGIGVFLRHVARGRVGAEHIDSGPHCVVQVGKNAAGSFFPTSSISRLVTVGDVEKALTQAGFKGVCWENPTLVTTNPKKRPSINQTITACGAFVPASGIRDDGRNYAYVWISVGNGNPLPSDNQSVTVANETTQSD